MVIMEAVIQQKNEYIYCKIQLEISQQSSFSVNSIRTAPVFSMIVTVKSDGTNDQQIMP
jgi:hypothetical protein